MIRIRRVPRRLPFGRVYEVEIAARDAPPRFVRTRAPTCVLEPELGIGDAWSFVDEADRQWEAGNRGGWAVEYEERPRG